MVKKYNLSEAAAEILAASVNSKRSQRDSGPSKLSGDVAYGTKEVGDIGTQVLKTTDSGPDLTRGVPTATAPGATPPVGSEPMKKLKGQPSESGSSEQPEGKPGRQMFDKNKGATFQSYGESVEEEDYEEEEFEEDDVLEEQIAFFEEYSDEEMINMLFSEGYDLDEAVSKSGYVELARRVSDPDYEGNTDHDAVVARARKAHGDKFANDLSSGASKMHFGRDNRSSGYDKLKYRTNRSMNPSHVTKSGKLTKSSQKGLKSSLKEEEKEGHEDAAQDKKMIKAMMKKKDMKEDIDALLQGENLSEEFASKAATIFEAAVNSRVTEIAEELQVELQEQFSDAIEQITEDFTTKINDYLNYMVEEWMKENELAIESGLRTEIVEDFIGGMRNLFIEHYIDIPEEKVDVVDELAAKVEELEQKLNEEMHRSIQFKKEINEHKKLEALQTVCEGLTQTQVEKMKTLAESVDFTTEEEFAEKLETLKEAYTGTSGVKFGERSALEEGIDVEEVKTDRVSYDPLIDAVAKTISKSVIK